MSASIFPTYKIARFALSHRRSLIVAALSALTPLMFYSSFSMSEEPRLPRLPHGVWAMLATVREPSLRHDALFSARSSSRAQRRAQARGAHARGAPGDPAAAALDVSSGKGCRGGWPLLSTSIGSSRRRRDDAPRCRTIALPEGVSTRSSAGTPIVAASGCPTADACWSSFAWHLPGRSRRRRLPFVAAIVAAVAFARAAFLAECCLSPRSASPSRCCSCSRLHSTLPDSDLGDVPRIHERFPSMSLPSSCRAARDGSDSGSGGFGLASTSRPRDRCAPSRLRFRSTRCQHRPRQSTPSACSRWRTRAAADSWRFPHATALASLRRGGSWAPVPERAPASACDVILVLIPLALISARS